MANIFPCPSCGGQLVFEPEFKRLRCTSCGSTYVPENYRSEEFDFKREIVTCPQCGGEIAAPSLDGMQFCPYCGSEIASAEHFSEMGYPDKIIPFGISKKECIDRYQKMVKGVPFLPDDLKTTDGLSSFVGMYTPYWIYNYEISGKVTVPIEKNESDATYDYHYTADMTTDLDCDISVGHDASQTLDDTVSEQMEPFFYDGLMDFNPNYMAGFYAENSTVEPSVYDDSSRARCRDIILDRMGMDASEHDGFRIESVSDDMISRELDPHISKSHGDTGAYLPMWFLTTKRHGRVAYTVVNGQTGATHADLPVDIAKYVRSSLIASVICAVVFLGIFMLFGTIDIRMVPYVTMILSSVLMIVASEQSRKIYRKENHLDDPGFTGKRARPGKSRVSGRGSSGSAAIGITAVAIIMIAMLVLISTGFDNILRVIAACVFIAGIVTMVLRARGSSSVTAVLALVGAVLSLADIIADPHSDVFMYGLIIVNLVIMIVTAIRLTYDYNRIATSPLPQFGKAGGGLNEKYS